MHLIRSLKISYSFLIKFHDFADNKQERLKHQTTGATQAQNGMTFRITLLSQFLCLWVWRGNSSNLSAVCDSIIKGSNSGKPPGMLFYADLFGVFHVIDPIMNHEINPRSCQQIELLGSPDEFSSC